MKRIHLATALLATIVPFSPVQAQSVHETPLCEAVKTNRIVELVYDEDVSKGCLPRVVDVHQVAIGNNGKLYLHSWQTRGCTRGRDYASERIFRFDKIKSVGVIEGVFNEKSQSVKLEGWDGCIGSNCFIKDKHLRIAITSQAFSKIVLSVQSRSSASKSSRCATFALRLFMQAATFFGNQSNGQSQSVQPLSMQVHVRRKCTG